MYTQEVPEGCRLCGTCEQIKPLSDFYKDGKTSDGKPKYRRDCRQCYKQARIGNERRAHKDDKH